MSDAVTVEQGMAKLRAFSEDLFVKAVTNAIRRAMSAGRSRAAELLKKSPVGQKLKRAKSGIPLVVKRGKLKMRNDFGVGQRSWAGSISASGFAALIETGGRTKRHSIKPKRAGGYSRRRSVRARQLAEGGRLLFQIGGRWVSPKIVTLQSGSRVPRNPFMEAGASHAQSVLTEQLQKGLQAAITKAGL